MSRINEWMMTPAHWYEFWMPQSGLVGGLIVGLILLAICIAVGRH